MGTGLTLELAQQHMCGCLILSLYCPVSARKALESKLDERQNGEAPSSPYSRLIAWCRNSEYANYFKIPMSKVGPATEDGHGMRFELEWSPTPGKPPELQIVTYAPPTYIGCATLYLHDSHNHNPYLETRLNH